MTSHPSMDHLHACAADEEERANVLLCPFCPQQISQANFKVHLELMHDFEVQQYQCPTCNLIVPFGALDISEAEDVGEEGPRVHFGRCPGCRQCFGNTQIIEAAKNRPVADSQPIYLVKVAAPSHNAPTMQDRDEPMEVDDEEQQQLSGSNKRKLPADHPYGPGPCPKMAKLDKN